MMQGAVFGDEVFLAEFAKEQVCKSGEHHV